MHFDTADNLINSAGKELGLWTSTVSNPFSHTDDNCLQLCALLNRVGRMLVRARPWSHLTKEFEIEAEPDVEEYGLPADFERLWAGTLWDRTATRQLGPVVTPNQWQALKARSLSGVAYNFRIRGNALWLTPIPAAADLLYLEYQSNRWVRPFGQTTPTERETTAITDTIWFDEALVVAALKLAFARAKGRDTTGLQAEYDETYSAAVGADGTAPVLNVSGGGGAPLLSDANLPDTGYGS